VDTSMHILLPCIALVYFAYRWEVAVSARRAYGYSIPLWLDAVGIVGIAIVEVGLAVPLLTDVPWFVPLWLSVSLSGVLLFIIAGMGVWRKVTRQALQISQSGRMAVKDTDISPAEKRRLARLKRKSSIVSISGAIAFLVCWGIGFTILDLVEGDISTLSVGLILGGSLLLLTALVWTALLRRDIRRIEGSRKQEDDSWWWE